MCCPKGYGFWALLVWKRGIHFAHFSSGIGYGFWGNYGSVWTYLLRQIQMNKKEIEIYQLWNAFEEMFCLCPNLSNDDIGLKTGMDFRGQVWKQMWKMTFFGLKYGQDLENRVAHPHQTFLGVPGETVPCNVYKGTVYNPGVQKSCWTWSVSGKARIRVQYIISSIST